MAIFTKLQKETPGFLRHPFVLLLITAAVLRLLVPYITQEWKNQSRKAEIKAKLVTDAGKTVASILTTAQFSEFGGQSRNQKELDSAFKAWEEDNILIGVRIRAYLVDSSISVDWRQLGNALRFAYASGVTNSRRKEYLAKLRKYLSGATVNWSALESGYADATSISEYNRAWYQLRGALLDQYGAVAQKILSAKCR